MDSNETIDFLRSKLAAGPPPFSPVGLFLKHEDFAGVYGAIGPLYYEGLGGDIHEYAKDINGNTQWFSQREASVIAKKLGLKLNIE